MMEQRIIDIERRFRQFILRGIVVRGQDGGPYTVSIQTEYAQTMYIANVLYLPFVTDIILQVPPHEQMDDLPSSASSSDNHIHNTDIPEHSHNEITVRLPSPKVDDRVLLWSPVGQPEELAMIIGKWRERITVDGDTPRTDYIDNNTVIIMDNR